MAPPPSRTDDATMVPHNLLLAALALLMTTPSCPPPGVAAPGQLAHTVYFWLKPDVPSDTAAEMIAFYRGEVTPLPGVVSVLVGEARRVETPRAVVDATYTLGVTTVFATAADEDVWQTHPVHERFLARFGHCFDKVQVYDTVAR
jgi:hypothetical protein